MRHIFLIFVAVLLGPLALLHFPKNARAASFSTTLESTYDVSESGNTSVTHVFKIENTVSTTFVTNYAFEAAGNRLKNVTVTSNGQKIEPSLTPQKNKTSISFAFPDKIVGAGQVREFTVHYETADVATKIGKVLEVSIPKLADPSLFSTYNVNIKVPSSYGNPTAAQPKIFTTSKETNQTILHFTKLQDPTGVSVTFGKTQSANVELTYHLENTSTSKGLMDVAFPADGMYQRVFYESIEPLPKSIRTDKDGNWVGSYELEANQKVSVVAKLAVQTQSTPQKNALVLSKHPGNDYLRAQPFWPVGNPQMNKLARQLQTPKAIYDYVVRTLHYGYDRTTSSTQRRGADGALSNPSDSLCTEFTDLFITLARSNRIPARAVIGYAYTQNADLRPVGFSQDVLHAWPQYWDDTTAQWISVDPTWENTTAGMDYFHAIDFNRIVFAIQGESSTAPLPAGMYKFANEESKDVVVTYEDSIPEFTDTFESNLRVHPRALLGLSDTYGVTIQNTSLHAVYGVPLTIQVQNKGGTLVVENKLTLIPREEKEIPVQLPHSGFFIQGPSTVTVTIGGKQFTHAITFKNTLQQIAPLLTILGVVAGSVGLCAVITWRLLVPRWKR